MNERFRVHVQTLIGFKKQFDSLYGELKSLEGKAEQRIIDQIS